MKRYSIALFVILSLIMFPLGLYDAWGQEKISIKLGSVGGPDSLHTYASNQLKRIVEERSKGQVEITVHHSGILGKDEVAMEGMRLGTHQMSSVASPVPALIPQCGIFDLPFLFPSREKVQEFEDSPLGQELLQLFPSKGLNGLAFWELGFRQITNNVRPIYTPKDLKGLKIRVPSSPTRMKMFQAYGSNPAALAYTELFSALQQGVVDGQENPLNSIYESKIYEVQKYLSMSNHVYTPAYLLVSKKHWDKWPDNVKKFLLDAAKEAAIMVKKRSAEWDKERMVFLSKKLKVNEIDFKSFQEASKPVYKEMENSIGQDFVRRTLQWIEKSK